MLKPEIAQPPQSGHLNRGTAYDPWEHADKLGLQILHRPLRTATSLWMPDYYTIVVRSGLDYASERVALARKIAHSELGHKGDCPNSELAADRFAAVNLISPVEFHQAAMRVCDRAAIARDLKVTRQLLDAYLLLTE